ncbi:MAG TPA: SDR family NAD(P)-dependent oxidoreductase [Polyangiaceae bacterium]|nr:SDR family NAD(P)-dependent oxidoreductase [Polyangiaceae bacterium]
MHVLITGGAGFIGSHVADELLRSGYKVRAIDNLRGQVHGPNAKRPAYLDDRVEFVHGDVRDVRAMESALAGVDAVVHLAAAVGVGQSMYEIAEYTSINGLGTAVLMEALSKRPVSRLVVASSMSIYGEGLYKASDGTLHDDVERSRKQLAAGDWEVRAGDGQALAPVPTRESKRARVSSIYALSKYDQERMCLICGSARGIPTVALRLFNTYGPRQALSNPYTGVLAIFGARLLNKNRPLVFEDGKQQRDFVSVYDVANAFRLALESDVARGHAINVGSGRPITVRALAQRLADSLGCSRIEPQVTGKHRVGDVRHCFADVRQAKSLLGYEPRVTLEEGLREYTKWLSNQQAADRVDDASRELDARGLTI